MTKNPPIRDTPFHSFNYASSDINSQTRKSPREDQGHLQVYKCRIYLSNFLANNLTCIAVYQYRNRVSLHNKLNMMAVGAL